MTEIIPKLEYVTIKRSEYDYLRAVVEDDWQPIETAPKDGTAILLYRDGKTGIGFITPQSMDDLQWFHTGAAWIGADDWDGGRVNVALGGYSPQEATHWMPLPEPPRGGNG